MKFIITIICLFSATWSYADPVISEFLASNDTGLEDENGDASDWIEIYNPDATSVNLSGWTLTDDISQPGKWTFPSVNLASGARLIVFASGKDRAVAGSELHTNFSLDGDGEYLALIKPGGDKTSEFNPYPKQKTDVSYGRLTLTDTLVNEQTLLSYILTTPPNDAEGDTWTEDDFDDSSWTSTLPASSTNTVNSGDIPKTVGGSGGSQALSSLTVSGLGGTITDVNVQLNISHTWTSDLDVFLIAPDGTRVELFTDIGGSGDHFNNTILDSQAGTAITSASNPFAATYRPEGNLNVLNGKTPNGVWRLEVTNDNGSFRFRSGTINSWSLTIVSNSGGGGGPAKGGIGYDTDTAYDPLIQTRVPTGTTELWVRYAFNVSDPSTFSSLTLRTKHDDGFEAHLNGTPIHSDNVTPPIQGHEATSEFTEVDVSQHLSALKAGQNVLAFRVVNTSSSSSDLLLLPELVGATQQAVYRFSPTPTPGTSNANQEFIGFVQDTKFTAGRGFYETGFSEIITSSTPGATIVYTIDGTEPTLSNGTQVPPADANTPPSANIAVIRTIAIRVAAFKSDFLPTNVDTNTYIFPSDVKGQTSAISQNTYGLPSSWDGTTPDYGMDSDVVGPGDSFGGVYAASIEDDLKEIPTLSIVMNQSDMFGSSGIYSHPNESGSNWERAISAELIHPDGTKGFQENCGLRIQGGAFRGFGLTKKKSLRLLFKKQYGKGKLSYDFFGGGAVTKFNTITLRMESNDGWQWSGANGQPQYARDQFGRETQLALGQPASRGNHMHVYINGVYWGMYNPVERPDSEFAASYFDIPEEEWDGINSGSTTNASDDPDRNARAQTAWNTLVSRAQAVADAGSRSARHAAYMDAQGKNADGSNNPSRQSYVDVTNYIDYLIVNYYGGNSDWPFKNYYCGRHNSASSDGFKFFMWDSEWSLLLRSNVNTDKVDDNRGVAVPFQDLRSSEAFRIHFADRAHRALFNGGPLYVDPSNPSWDPSHPERNRPAARYHSITERVKKPLVAESARWGDQHRSTPYTVNAEWTTERNNILTNWMPVRSANFLQILKNKSLYPNTDAPVFSQHGGSIASGFQLSMTNPGGNGTIYYTSNGVDPLQINSDGTFSVSGSAQTYSSAITLTANTTVKARVLNNGDWSALNEADFTLGATPSVNNLVISEFSYRPADSSAGADDGDDFEFIEIMNIGNESVDLGNLEFDQGITFDFSTVPLGLRNLAAGARVVIVEDSTAFQSRYGNSITILGQWTGKLDNGGETLRLRIKGGATIREFTYNDRLPWPVCADGDGYSLVLINPSSNPDHSNPSNWRCSVQNHGNPGSSDSLPAFSGNANTDNDLDGLPALVEHLLGGSDNDGTDAQNLLSSGLIEITDQTTTRHLTLTFRRTLGADDLTSVVEVSPTMQSSSWQTGSDHVVLMSQVHNGDGTVTETWRSVANVSSTTELFIRLKVIQN